jgi:hypothetical protein
MDDNRKEWTLSVEEAGRRYFNMSRNGSYAAAKKGFLPVIRIGGKVLANVRAIERMFEEPAT